MEKYIDDALKLANAFHNAETENEKESVLLATVDSDLAITQVLLELVHDLMIEETFGNSDILKEYRERN